MQKFYEFHNLYAYKLYNLYLNFPQKLPTIPPTSAGVPPAHHVGGHQQRRRRGEVAPHVLGPEAVGARGQGRATGGPGEDLAAKTRKNRAKNAKNVRVHRLSPGMDQRCWKIMEDSRFHRFGGKTWRIYGDHIFDMELDYIDDLEYIWIGAFVKL